jgi:HsdM N-terminal domain
MSMFEQAFKNIDDVLWKEAGCTTELDYTEQTSWLLFLKYLDDLEQDKATEAARLYLFRKSTFGRLYNDSDCWGFQSRRLRNR